MRTLDHHRLVIAYHGCDASVRDQVIQRGGSLVASQNDYDWLGHGIYFWEHGPARAMEWAEQQRKRGNIKTPAVLGAILHLGHCFDLLDVRFTNVLAESWPEFCEAMADDGQRVPRNEAPRPDDPDNVLRRRDCAVINWTLQRVEIRANTLFDSARAVFQEGEPAFPGSEIRRRSHIQIAVRHPACILGYFLPSFEGL